MHTHSQHTVVFLSPRFPLFSFFIFIFQHPTPTCAEPTAPASHRLLDLTYACLYSSLRLKMLSIAMSTKTINTNSAQFCLHRPRFSMVVLSVAWGFEWLGIVSDVEAKMVTESCGWKIKNNKKTHRFEVLQLFQKFWTKNKTLKEKIKSGLSANPNIFVVIRIVKTRRTRWTQKWPNSWSENALFLDQNPDLEKSWTLDVFVKRLFVVAIFMREIAPADSPECHDSNGAQWSQIGADGELWQAFEIVTSILIFTFLFTASLFPVAYFPQHMSRQDPTLGVLRVFVLKVIIEIQWKALLFKIVYSFVALLLPTTICTVKNTFSI